jgi:geranylgeranyl pyrophosphate synthase
MSNQNGTGNDFEEYLSRQVAKINVLLEKYIPKEANDEFLEAMLGKSVYRYDKLAITKAILEPTWHLIGLGGKRWRPTMMLLMIEALGKDSNQYAEFALVPEIIHNATLVIDDIEDKSQSRRGAPSVHIKYGEDVAINVGNAMYYYPMMALIKSSKLNDNARQRMLMTYMEEMMRLHIGQGTDIAWHSAFVPAEKITEEEYLQMCYNKTGVLGRMACRLGAIIGGADEQLETALGNLGASIGVAFQVYDDILNITPSELAQKKGGVGDDITEGKITLMAIHALKSANSEDKARLLSILKMSTRDKALINEAIGIMDRCGGIAYAQEKRMELAKQAWEEVDKQLDDSHPKEMMKSLIDYLVTRTV